MKESRAEGEYSDGQRPFEPSGDPAAANRPEEEVNCEQFSPSRGTISALFRPGKVFLFTPRTLIEFRWQRPNH